MLQRSWARGGLATVYAVFVVYAAIVLLTSPGDALNAFVTDWLYQGLIATAAVIAAARAVHVAEDRLAWSVIAAALACTSFAELYFIAFEPEAYPSVSDVFWIAFYPLAYAGMVLLLRRRTDSIARPLWLDGLTASVAAGALGAAVLLEVVLATAEGSRSEIATNLAYPLGDVLLLSAVFGVFSLAGWRLERRWLLLGLGLLATAVADGVYLFTVDTYQAGAAIDVLWPLSSLLIATAAWVRANDEKQLHTHGRPLLAVPAACALVAIGILLYDHFAQLNVVAVGLATVTLLLVIVRLGLTFRENARLFALTHHESLTDALTGISNRRRLLADLHRVLEPPTPATLLMIFDLDGFKGYNDSFGHPAGDALLVRLAEKLTASLGDVGASYRLGGDEFCVVAPIASGEAELLIDRTCGALSEKGEGFEVTSSFGAVLLPDEATDVSAALSLADERLYAQKQARRGGPSQSMDAFLEALATQEPTLHAHLEGVAALALEVGQRLGLDAAMLEELSRAAQLHDLGKVAVPDEILSKTDALDEREWEFIRQHTVVGERILRASPAFREAATIVRSSHERWDGTGYPDGLAGDEIPLASRIVSACDAFEAMTSTRPYRVARSVEDALAELRRCSATQFDPAIVDVFVSVLRDRVQAA
ncbi:MAG TPA: diguanylate cyclase [Gaiella sp.]|nr:diguanylate cyclase [Gaiella sp.]